MEHIPEMIKKHMTDAYCETNNLIQSQIQIIIILILEVE